MSASMTIDYGPRQRLMWASRHGGKLILVALILSLAGGTYFYWKPLAFRAQWIYWSHRCASFSMPSASNSLIDDPQAMTTLGANPDYASVMYNGGKRLMFQPHVLRELAKFDPRLDKHEPVLFFGSLQRPDGAPRLVELSSWGANGFAMLLDLDVRVIPPAGLFQCVSPGTTSPGYAWSGPWIPTRFQTATVDPNDRSHMLINFEVSPMQHPLEQISPVTGVMDVYLQNDDSLRFKLRDTPELKRCGISLKLQRGRIIDASKPSAEVSQSQSSWY